MKPLIILFALCLSIGLPAQEYQQKIDFRTGIGLSILGTGDMRATMFEHELNYTMNNYFASSLSVGYGKSNNGVFDNASFIQTGVNLFVSPFRNTGRNDFRIGTGLSYFKVSDGYLQRTNGVDNYISETRTSPGVNLILENTYSIGTKTLVGLKLFSNPYFNGDINSGILFKLGLKF